ncbi:glycoside hydrolase family 3 C-terminal domain-containing protein [Pirellulales bacterium]|nr:glycoside hydrolase family 3 C-terminal domain-containing protein [Pirellulales bacterium]
MTEIDHEHKPKSIMNTKNYLSVVVVSLLSVITCFDNASGDGTLSKEEMLFWDHTQPLDARVEDLASRLTLTEKIQHLGPNSAAIERLGIEPYVHWNHATHGVAACLLYPDTDSTVYPSPINQAATWNPELIQKMADAIADEARAKFHREEKLIGGLTFWSPTVNMARDPRWGRTCEAYGEDPYLASRMAVAFSKGLQGNDPKYFKTIATPKHFIANNDERIRERGNADVPERSLREYFMRPYRAAIQEAKAYSVMMAYNKLNGVPCVANQWLIGDLLRGEWGFDGFVVSDAGCIGNMYAKMHYVDSPEEAAALGLHAGCDVSIAGGYGYLGKALERGLVTEQQIDVSVRRMFKARFLLGEFDPPQMVPYTNISQDVIASQAHRELSRQLARESIVLLKNDKGILPLSKNLKTIAVVGPNHNAHEWGTYNGKSVNPETPLQGIRQRLGNAAQILTAPGCRIPGSPRFGHNAVQESEPISADDVTAPDGRQGWQAEYFNNIRFEGPAVLERIDPAIAFDWGDGSPAPGVNQDHFSVRWRGSVRPPVSRSYKLMVNTDDGVRITLDGKSLFDHLHGALDSSTGLHLDESRAYEISVEYVEAGGAARAKFGWDYISPEKVKAKQQRLEMADNKAIAKAVEQARRAEVAIVVVGTSAYVESEGYDRVEIKLPGRQQELIQQVYAANPKTVVVLINGSSLALPWVKQNVPAVVEAFFSGPDVGTALADVLFGDYNPSGKLPLTFYQSMDQLPPMADYDVIEGERTYLYFPGPVCFPFGHGLSYTEFKYSNLDLSSTEIEPEGEITVTLDVENVGKRVGAEVVQLYAKDLQSRVKRPRKELVAFDKISLDPGEKTRIRFTFKGNDLAFWDVQTEQWVVEPGAFQLMAGASSQDIRLTKKFAVK